MRMKTATHSNYNIMRAISGEQIEALAHSSPDMFHGLGEIYAKFAQRHSFDFDYCDIVSDKAEIFYRRGDLRLKARVALAMLELGTSHNRWRVEHQFMRMAGPEIQDALAERIAVEIAVQRVNFADKMRHVESSIPVTRHQLHPTLLAPVGYTAMTGQISLRSQSVSLVGPRGDNQDHLLAPIRTGADWWCAIADGVGGSEHGGLASRMCIDALRQHVGDNLSMTTVFTAVFEHLLQNARGAGGRHSMSSTLSVLRLSRGTAFVGHVGDTRITHYRGHGVMSRTRDQTEAQRLLDEGVISPHQARRYPRRNVLLSAMSPRGTYTLYQNTFGVVSGDRILLTTDGFHNKLRPRQVARMSVQAGSFLAFFQSMCRELADIALNDDATCLAVEIA